MTQIFIIDDEEQIAEMLGEVVALSGFDAIIYTDATLFFQKICLMMIPLLFWISICLQWTA